jgi:hypothetical protein
MPKLRTAMALGKITAAVAERRAMMESMISDEVSWLFSICVRRESGVCHPAKVRGSGLGVRICAVFGSRRTIKEGVPRSLFVRFHSIHSSFQRR